jgi:hypothetical protein
MPRRKRVSEPSRNSFVAREHYPERAGGIIHLSARRRGRLRKRNSKHAKACGYVRRADSKTPRLRPGPIFAQAFRFVLVTREWVRKAGTAFLLRAIARLSAAYLSYGGSAEITNSGSWTGARRTSGSLMSLLFLWPYSECLYTLRIEATIHANFSDGTGSRAI